MISFFRLYGDYQNNPSQEVLDWIEGKKEEYQQYMHSHDRKVELQKAEVVLHEKQVRKTEKEAKKQEELAMSFFSEMNPDVSANSSKEGNSLS